MPGAENSAITARSASAGGGVFFTREKLLTRRGVIWLGQTCNIRCHFCYFLDRINDKDHPEHAFMELDKARKICSDLRNKFGNTSVDIQGGEPTLWRHINELVAYCAGISLQPTLITNAIALTKKHKVEELKAAGVRDLLISVQGLGPIYDEIVGLRGGSQKQMLAIDHCVETGVPFRFNCVLSMKALPQYVDIARLAVEKGARAVNFLAFNPFEDQANGGKRSIENVPRYAEVGAMLDRALDVLDAAGIEANVRYFPICMVSPRHRKSIYNFQQLPYDAHEWDFDSWTWTGYQPQKMRGGPTSPHHLSLAQQTYSSRIFNADQSNGSGAPQGLRKQVDALVNAVPAVRDAAISAYRSIRRTIERVNRLAQRGQSGAADELGRSPAVYRDHACVRALDHCGYRYAPACAQCDAKPICDGFHGDYAAMFGTDEAKPIAAGGPIDDPKYFIREQVKIYEAEELKRPWRDHFDRAA